MTLGESRDLFPAPWKPGRERLANRRHGTSSADWRIGHLDAAQRWLAIWRMLASMRAETCLPCEGSVSRPGESTVPGRAPLSYDSFSVSGTRRVGAEAAPRGSAIGGGDADVRTSSDVSGSCDAGHPEDPK